jgi:protein-S-isoprenylcysteine O-methyltransferase Ste14
LQQWLAFPWRLAGLLPLGIGVALNLIADQAFRKHDTTVKPFVTSNSLITGGVFSVSRNPMYLGMALILLGLALLLGSLSPFTIVIALPVLLRQIYIIPEEQMLDETFGEQYREYCHRVRRWI